MGACLVSSAWGKSWAAAWGNSWGVVQAETEDVLIGGKGDNQKRGKSIFKPTGLEDRRPSVKITEGRKTVEERIEETRGIAEVVREVAAAEFFREAEDYKPIEIMTLSEIDAEIGALMRKKYRDMDDEEMLMLLMLVAQVI